MVVPVLSESELVTAPVAPAVLDAEVLAEAMVQEAIAQARTRLSRRDSRLDDATLLGRAPFMASVKSGLAQAIAAALAANDRQVRAVYIFDPGLNADSEDGVEVPQDLTLHLIVQVETASPALEALISALDGALVERLKTRSVEVVAQRRSLIAATIITDHDIRLGVGAAGMLSAVFAPPIKLWG